MSVWVVTSVTMGGTFHSEMFTEEAKAALRYRELEREMLYYLTINISRFEVPGVLDRHE